MVDVIVVVVKGVVLRLVLGNNDDENADNEVDNNKNNNVDVCNNKLVTIIINISNESICLRPDKLPISLFFFFLPLRIFLYFLTSWR